MKIRSKLLSSFSVLIILSIILGFISYKTIKDLSSNIYPMLELNSAVKIHMLQLRRNEKDFLTRSLIDETYFESGESKYLTQFEQNYVMLKQEVDDLDHFSRDDDYHKNMVKMQKLIFDYRKQFMDVVNKKTERGFKDWGTIGQLRKSVHNIEETLQQSIIPNKDNLLVTLLMCRRHEKDYLLRNDFRYKQILSSRVDEFIYKVKNSNASIAQQDELIRLIEDYRNKFYSVVAVDEKIGRTSYDGLMGSYRKTIHKLEPLVAEQDIKLKSEVEMLVDRTSLILLALIGFITLVGITLAFILSSRITKPLIKMTNIGNQVSSGDLSVDMPVIKSNDEIKEMGDTMNLLISAIRFHLNK